MMESVLSQIEAEILELPADQQLRLISRVAEKLSKKAENPTDFDMELAEMANDPDIQRELREIDRDFRITELDGLAE